MKKREELEELTKMASELEMQLSINYQKINDLLKFENVNQYEKLRSETEQLTSINKKTSENIRSLEMSLCNHNLWFLINDYTDPYESRTYWNCKCIECGKDEETRNKEFKDQNVIITPQGVNRWALYNAIKTDYNILKKDDKITQEEIITVLLIRYSEENMLTLKENNDSHQKEKTNSKILKLNK